MFSRSKASRWRGIRSLIRRNLWIARSLRSRLSPRHAAAAVRRLPPSLAHVATRDPAGIFAISLRHCLCLTRSHAQASRRFLPLLPHRRVWWSRDCRSRRPGRLGHRHRRERHRVASARHGDRSVGYERAAARYRSAWLRLGCLHAGRGLLRRLQQLHVRSVRWMDLHRARLLGQRSSASAAAGLRPDTDLSGLVARERQLVSRSAEVQLHELVRHDGLRVLRLLRRSLGDLDRPVHGELPRDAAQGWNGVHGGLEV